VVSWFCTSVAGALKMVRMSYLVVSGFLRSCSMILNHRNALEKESQDTLPFRNMACIWLPRASLISKHKLSSDMLGSHW
jgi:hypothetical protein